MTDLLDRIETNPKIMLGKPVIKGTRITGEIILKKLAQDISIDEILQDYPGLTREDIQAALIYTATALNTEEILPHNFLVVSEAGVRVRPL